MNFNSEKIGYKISSAHERLSKKYATFFTIPVYLYSSISLLQHVINKNGYDSYHMKTL